MAVIYPFPNSLNEDPKVALFSVFTVSSIFEKYNQITESKDTIPKTKKINFQSPNCPAKNPANGAATIDPIALINWEKLKKLERLLEGTTSTSNGLADT